MGKAKPNTGRRGTGAGGGEGDPGGVSDKVLLDRELNNEEESTTAL